ncbi:MAG TPA: Holliday junction branch migration protein RuvA [Kiritimatiellia bacterium]|nr:Holliday junction branch migration protein RuvA [Kiritimatiellia bacterium]HSA17143.1 Holliday junction branch migration protein RuvA [Kiritimatiellia bacterium]
MITFLEGRLVEKDPTRVVLNVQGVGYEVFIPLSSYDRLPAPGEPARLLTYDHVREDLHALYGFMTEDERRLFLLLMSVSGIGPRLALTALSGLSVRDLKAAVAQGDIKRLSSISGIGKKTAERMVVELRDKLTAGEALEAVAGAAAGEPDARLRDAILALVSLGYKQADAQKRVRDVLPGVGPKTTVEEIVRKALAP